MNAPYSGKAVVLLSGGIDSSTTLAMANAEGYELYTMSFDYHQRHCRELESARVVSQAFNVKKHLVISFNLRDIGGSALTSEMEVPKTSAKVRKCRSAERKNIFPAASELPSFRASELIPVTYVPARNTIFLSFALAWAEVLEAENIFIGANAVDYSGYPDCRPEYLSAFEVMANLATKLSVEGKLRFTIKAPLLSMRKSEIIKKGIELGIDYSLTWSCYDPQPIRRLGVRGKGQGVKRLTPHSSLFTDFVPCGRCDSCLIRQKGFREAGIKDPLTSLYDINEV